MTSGNGSTHRIAIKDSRVTTAAHQMFRTNISNTSNLTRRITGHMDRSKSDFHPYGKKAWRIWLMCLSKLDILPIPTGTLEIPLASAFPQILRTKACEQ